MRFPIFPLNGAVLFPGTNLPLNIFEKRYIEMVDYSLSNNRLIGMIQTKENNDLFDIGCVGKITSFSETADARYEINLEGINRFKIIKIIKTEHKFISVDANVIESKKDLKEDDHSLNKRLLLNFNKFLNSKKINFSTAEFEELDTLSLAKMICIIAPLDYLVKQMLLEFDSEYELCDKLISALEIETQSNNESSKVN